MIIIIEVIDMVFKKQKDKTINGGNVWVSTVSPDLWCGFALNKDGHFKGKYTVITQFGLQPKPFSKRADAIKFLKDWMKEMETHHGA
jgi:hypothetical protein